MINNRLLHGAKPMAALLAAGLLSLAGPAALTAQQPAPERFAVVNVTAAGVDFAPAGPFANAVVTLAGGDQHLTYEFAAGERPWLNAVDAEGQPLADGIYKWELSLMPDRETRGRLLLEASQNGGTAPSALERQTGIFTVVNGAIVDPSLTEPGASRDGGGAVKFSAAGALGDAEAADAARSAAVDSDLATASGLSEAAVRAELARAPAGPVAGAAASARAGQEDADGSGQIEDNE